MTAKVPSRAPVSASGSFRLNDAIIAISLANLLVVRLWATILDPSNGYYLHQARTPAAYWGTLAVPAVIALAGIAAAALYRRTPFRILEAAFLATTALAALGMRTQLEDFVGASITAPRGTRTEGIPLQLVTAALGIAILVASFLPLQMRARLRRVVARALLILSPFVPLTVGQAVFAAWGAGSGREAAAFLDRAPAPKVHADPGERVVVIVMDELDEFLAFEDRPEGTRLPVFDSFRNRAFIGTRAVSPAHVTERALPSLLTGRRVVRTEAAGRSDRRLFFEDGTNALFSDVETILGETTRRDRNVAMVGWYLPYCRVLGDDVSLCFSRSYRQELQGMSLSQVFVRQMIALAGSFPYGRRILRAGGLDRPVTSAPPWWHAETFRQTQTHALAAVADPDFALVFIHHPMPHLPGIWDTEDGVLRETNGGSYRANLELADRSLGEILAAIEEAGLSSRTTVVVLADHGKRGENLAPLPSSRLHPGEVRPVPFLVRLPAAADAVDYDGTFPAICLKRLVPALLDRQFETHSDVREWAAAESPEAIRSTPPGPHADSPGG